MHTIFIVGNGAIGRSLAVFLQAAGKKVLLVRGRQLDDQRTTRRIRVQDPAGATKEADIEMVTLNDLSSLEGLVVLTNKSYGNAQLATSLKGKTGHSPLVLLQNGLGVEQPFLDQDFP